MYRQLAADLDVPHVASIPSPDMVALQVWALLDVL
jgi:hypothetical protein